MICEDTHLSNSKKTKLSIRKYLLFAICDVSRDSKIYVSNIKSIERKQKNYFYFSYGKKKDSVIANKTVNLIRERIVVFFFNVNEIVECHNSYKCRNDLEIFFQQIIELYAILKNIQTAHQF